MTKFKIIELSNSSNKSSNTNYFPQISGEKVVWKGTDAKGNSEIFFYNGEETIQITNNDVTDKSPAISGNNIVWVGEDGWNEIFFYNGNETIQLTNNKELSEVSIQLDGNPKVDGNRVVWQRLNLSNATTSVMLATVDNTKSASSQYSDRQLKFVTSSTIIILSLIFLCWLKS